MASLRGAPIRAGLERPVWPDAQEGGQQGDKLAGTPGCLLHTQAPSPRGSRAVEGEGRGARGGDSRAQGQRGGTHGSVDSCSHSRGVGAATEAGKAGRGSFQIPPGSFSTYASLNQCLRMTQKKEI